MSGIVPVNKKTDISQNMLEAGIAASNCYISRNYLVNMDKKPVLSISDDECNDMFLRLYHVERFVYDKKENINDKMISVYSALHELEGTALLLVYSYGEGVDFYLGVRSKKEAAVCGEVLRNSVLGQFPGSSVKSQKGSEIRKILTDLICGSEPYENNISAVAVVPSMRDEDKDKFVQGIEKLIDTMQGKEYTALFVAAPINKEGLEQRKRGLEEIASMLSPFSKTTLAYGTNYSKAVSNGISNNFSSAINQSISKTIGFNSSVTKSSSYSFSSGSNSSTSYSSFGITDSSGTNSSSSWSESESVSMGKTWAESLTEGTTDTYGKSQNISDTVTQGDNRTFTIEHNNKTIENLLKTINEQLKRIKDCEAFGLWDCAAYFLSPEIHVSVMAANTYKALVAGDATGVENSYINVWEKNNKNVPNVSRALRYGVHPPVLVRMDSKLSIRDQVVTPGSFISGKELPLFMGVPQKSVSGLTVSGIAEFARGVFTLDNHTPHAEVSLGNIFHMGRMETADVSLDLNSFTSHCFISGSTGSGKSNTSYVLLNEFYKRNIPFLVIEPAKGEYKSEFANVPGIHIYSTNPRFGQMLHINPFWFDYENIHVLEHLDRLIEIFNACWEMYAAMPAILKAAAERVYTEKGWDLLNSTYLGAGNPVFPTFDDLLRVLPEIIKSSSYSADTQGDYTGALVTRVASLANGITGQIFCSNYAIPDSTLFDENTIVDLSRVGSTETKALIMGLLVMKLTEYRMAQATGSNSKLRHITVLEEAHNLLKRTGTSQGQETANLLGKSVEMISNSIAEMRTYGEGFIIIDQSPTAVDISAIKNTNTKIIMRLPEKADCEAVGNAMALNEEQVKELAKLPTGVAAVIQNNWLETVLVKIRRAPQEYHGEIAPVDVAALRELRGVVATKVFRQYYDDRRFDFPAIEDAVSKVNAPEHKKQEVLESAKSLIIELGSQRNVRLVVQWLLSFSCCQSAFDIHEHSLRLVNFQDRTKEDLAQLSAWRDGLEKSVLNIIGIDPKIVNFFVRNLIYAQSLKKTDADYYSVYEMLYVEPGEKEVPEQRKPVSAIENSGEKVL